MLTTNDSVRGEVGVTATRAAKWAAAAQPNYDSALATGSMSREQLAAVAGEMQWCSAVLPPRRQAYLTEFYAACGTLLISLLSSLAAESDPDELWRVGDLATAEQRGWLDMLQRECVVPSD
eukprot:jgi/Tetstr1/427235/TSEL_017422.t1